MLQNCASDTCVSGALLLVKCTKTNITTGAASVPIDH